MILGVVFDLDGLMVYSEDVGYDAWQRTLAPHGKALTDEQYRSMIGSSQREAIEFVIETMGIRAVPGQLESAFWQALLESANRGVREMTGLRGLVDDLRRRGLRLGVASNSITAYVRKVVDQIGMTQSFDCLIGVDQVPNGKPAPDLYLLAAQRLGFQPRECLAIEDSPSGVAAAVAAGLTCVLVPNPDLALEGSYGAHYTYQTLRVVHAHLDQILTSGGSAAL